jgi:hypothetical protein
MAKIGGKRLSLYDKFKTNPSANMILNMPLAAGMSKGDMAKKKSKENKERVGFDENYDASENTIGNLTDVLGIADLYDKQSGRPTFPSSGMTIPSSAYMEDEKGGTDSNIRSLMQSGEVKESRKSKKEKEEEEDRPKGLFGFLDGVELDGDALIKAGRAIEKGEGLGGAIEAYNDEMQANQAAEVAKQEKEYDRKRQAKLDELDMAVQLNEIAYKQSQMTSDDQKLAQDAAIAEAREKGITDLDSAEFAAIYSSKLDQLLSSKKPTTLTLSDINNQIGMNTLGFGAYGDPDAQAALSGQGGNVKVIPMTDVTK